MQLRLVAWILAACVLVQSLVPPPRSAPALAMRRRGPTHLAVGGGLQGRLRSVKARLKGRLTRAFPRTTRLTRRVRGGVRRLVERLRRRSQGDAVDSGSPREASGRAPNVRNDDEKRDLVDQIKKKYAPDTGDAGAAERAAERFRADKSRAEDLARRAEAAAARATQGCFTCTST